MAVLMMVGPLLLSCAPAATAIETDAPLPPPAVLAAWDEGGVVVAWLPPAYDGGSPVTAYKVHRLNEATLPTPTWELVGQTMANVTSLIDPGVSEGVQAIYSVTALNQNGPSPSSPPSPPIMASSSGGGNGGGEEDDPFYLILLLYLGPHVTCSPIGLGPNPNFPYVANIDEDCLPPI